MKINKDKLHQNLGTLFYAIAMADKKVNDEELVALKTAILKKWYAFDSNPSDANLDRQHDILCIFNHLQTTNTTADVCFSEFQVFFKEHQNLFNEDLKKFIWHTAQAIASSFAKKNKSELVLLAKLKMLLET